MNYKGYGFARYIHEPVNGSNGKHLKLMIKNVVPGDRVRVSVPNARGRNKAVLHYDELLEASPDRDMTIPPTQGAAGGAPLQFMKYEKQLAYKEQLVKQYLAEQGFDEGLVQPIIGMQEPKRYRNKMELSFGRGGEIGMHEQGDPMKVIDLEDSILAPEIMIEVKHLVASWQKEWGLPGYNKETVSGLLRNLVMRYAFATGELMIVIYATQAAAEHQEAADDLVERLKNKFAPLKSLQWIKYASINERVAAEETEILYGRDFIYDELNGNRFRIWPDTFFQVNPVQAEVLVNTALAVAEVTPEMQVIDLFCGIGTFSLPFAQRAKRLAGIEIVEKSIESAKRNANDNHIDNTYFIASDARKGLLKLKDEWGTPDLLILDPPRSGAGGKMMRAIGRLAPERVLYVSCSAKSLALDLVWLRDFGYEVKTVQPVDQFPSTVHVETVVMLSHKKPDSVINVKVEFGEGEGKVPLDNIAKRAAAYKPKERVTYKMIKEYIEAKYGFKVHTAYIAEVKRDLGLPMYDAPNAVEELKQPRKHPTAEKVEAIKDALKHFEVI